MDLPRLTYCPSCTPLTTMSEFEADIAIDVCRTCNGMFLDDGEVDELVAGLPPLHSLTQAGAISLTMKVEMKCPVCQHGMAERVLRGDRPFSLWTCTSCQGLWLPSGALETLKEHAVVERRRAPATATPSGIDFGLGNGRTDESVVGDGDLAFSRLGFGGEFASFYALPVVFVLAGLLHLSGFGKLLSYLVGMPFHELGHAVVAWLGGRFAIPFPFITYYFGGRSVWMFIVLASLMGWMMYRGVREGRPFVVVLGAVVIVLQVYLTFVIHEYKLDALFLLGGQLGEIVLSTLMMAAFYFKLPDRVRWDVWRWVALVPAAICLLRARYVWSRAVTDLSQLPWGSAVGSSNDGDMNRIVDNYGFMASWLANFYSTVTYLALAAVLVLYVYHAYEYKRSRA